MQKSPYKFLDSYSKEDRDIFFGRDKEIEELYSEYIQKQDIGRVWNFRDRQIIADRLRTGKQIQRSRLVAGKYQERHLTLTGASLIHLNKNVSTHVSAAGEEDEILKSSSHYTSTISNRSILFLTSSKSCSSLEAAKKKRTGIKREKDN